MPNEPTELTFADNSLAIACTRGREAIVSRFRELLHREQLTDQQWRVLRILYDHAPMIAAELSDLSCIHKVSLSRIVAGLEQSDLIERTPSASDRRATVLCLTSAGTELMDRLTPIASGIYDGIVADFGIDRYQELLLLLRELAAINDTDPANAAKASQHHSP